MDRWQGRVAVVTGASAGIGHEIARQLVLQGLSVVGLARRAQRVQELADSLHDSSGKLYVVQTDLNKEEDILAAFKWVKENLGGVDVLVNNAGVMHRDNLSEGKTADWSHMYGVNVIALSICTREAIRSMKERGVDDGHIIHINSVLGHTVTSLSGLTMYSSTKHAVTALTEGLRKELKQLASKIKVTSISPGAVESEMTTGAAVPDDDYLRKLPMLKPVDVAQAVLYTLSTPPCVQVHEITIHPTGEMV